MAGSFSRLFTSPFAKHKMGLYAAIACSFGTFAISYLPHTIFLDEYYDIVELRKLDKPIPILPQIKKLWGTVLNDLNLGNKIIKPFTVFGFDVWHAGTLNSKYGSIIGLPINFTYTDIKSMNKDFILIDNEPVDWNREDAKLLLDNILLSDNAKKYAMAREILMTNNHQVYIRAVANSVLLGLNYIVASRINRSSNIFEKSRPLRIFMYLCTGVFFWGVWAMQNDELTKYYEHDTDKQLCELGVDYIEGAIEFYHKTLKRNIALRTLFGSYGERIFTAGGNTTYIIRMKNLPLTYRKKFFEDTLKEHKAVNISETVVNYHSK